MKAWRLHSFGDFRLDEVPIPEVPDRYVLLKVKIVQPSVTDAQTINGAATMSSARTARLMEKGVPAQLGHEYCGEVVQTGKGVTSVKIGDRVTSAAEIYCGVCKMCLSGKPSRCLSPLHVGIEIPGAFAEYMSVPEWALVKVPEGPSDNEVAALQPLSSCVASVQTAQVGMGETVVVIGLGPIGLGILQVARLAGAGLIIAVGTRAENLELANKYGASATLNPALTDPVAEVRKLAGGWGADIVFECVGAVKPGRGPEPIPQAFAMVRSGGKVVQSSNPKPVLELDTVLMRSKKIAYLFPMVGTREFMALAAFWIAAGRIKVAPQISYVLKGIENLPEAIKITGNKAEYHAINPAQLVM